MGCFRNQRYWPHFTEIFAKAGLTKYQNPETARDYISWEITVKGMEELYNTLQKLYLTLVNEWSLEVPTVITPDMREVDAALVMRRKFGTDRKGIELINQWINANKRPNMRDVNY